MFQAGQVVTLTDRAADQVKSIMAKQGAGLLRVGVKNGGCAGMEYVMEFVNEPAKFDERVQDKGVEIVIDAKAVLFLLGAEIDYETAQLHSRFVFKNPNQTDACGCGESVTLSPAKQA
jgi:iron-sulfur cluster assembly protein